VSKYGTKIGETLNGWDPQTRHNNFFFWGGVITGCPLMVYAMQAIWARRLGGFGLREYGGH